MKKHDRSKFFAALVVPIFTLAFLGAAFAEEKEEHGGKKEEVKIPDNYSDAVAAIEGKRDSITKLIEAGKLADLHKEGEVIKKIAESLAKLASKDDSGIAKSDIKEINLTAKALAATYNPLDEAGDNGKKDEAKKVFDEMVKLIDTLKKFAKKK